jgi:phosphopantetheinyl transferase (holo-ACP synthase)
MTGLAAPPVPAALVADLPETGERRAAYGLLDTLLREAGLGTVACLVKDALGRPHDPARPGLWVSVSHTEGAVAAAVRAGGRVGIDVEARAAYDPLVADLVLTGAERRAVEAAADVDDAFLRLWVRKEAIGKAIGVGIDDDVLACEGGGDSVVLRGVRLRLQDVGAPVGCRAAVAMEITDSDAPALLSRDIASA